MASINWQKSTTQKAGAMRIHFGKKEREEYNHSNEHIQRNLSNQNYTIGCSDYSDAFERMKARTKAVDEILPPLRVRKDRVTCCFLCVPCPRILTERGQSDDFFKKAHAIYEDFFGVENVHGSFVHKDEVHEYIDENGNNTMSCEHMHTLVSAFTAEKGINGKAFETRGRLRALNADFSDMCKREFGINFNTGEIPQRKSIGTLKKESAKRAELVENTTKSTTRRLSLTERLAYAQQEADKENAANAAITHRQPIHNRYDDGRQ